MIQLLTSRDFQIGVLTGVLGVFGIYLLLLLLGVVLRPWLYAKASGVDVMVRQLIGMRLRRVDPRLVIAAYVRDQKRGGHHSLDVIEATYLAFGNDVTTGADLLAIVDREASRRSDARSGDG